MGSGVSKIENRLKDVKISHLTTENGKISPLVTYRVRLGLHPRLFVKRDEMRKVRSVNGKRADGGFSPLFEKEAMAPSHLQIILITERGSLP